MEAKRIYNTLRQKPLNIDMDKVALRRGTDFDRGDYDADNPSPMAYNISPTHIDQAGDFLWHIPHGVTGETKTFTANMCRRSRAMEDVGCDGCTLRHRKERQGCSANRNGPSFLSTVPQLRPSVYRFYSMTAEKRPLIGVWWLRDYWAGTGSTAHMGVLVRVDQ